MISQERLEETQKKIKQELTEEIMSAANVMPSDAKNMGLGGRGAKAFKNYVAKNKKHPGKVGMFKYPVPKFNTLIK